MSRRFCDREQSAVESVIRLRRDVRGNRFRSDPVEEGVLDRIIDAGLRAPSVGYSQPWEIVVVSDDETRGRIRASFDAENERAADCFEDERAALYRQLKLEGIREAPIGIAVFYRPPEGPVLGQTSMSETGRFSVVCAIQNMWLMARACNIGMGWVSILDPREVRRILAVPPDRELVAYLCVGHTDDFLDRPELEALGWEKRRDRAAVVYRERYGSTLSS